MESQIAPLEVNEKPLHSLQQPAAVSVCNPFQCGEIGDEMIPVIPIDLLGIMAMTAAESEDRKHRLFVK